LDWVPSSIAGIKKLVVCGRGEKGKTEGRRRKGGYVDGSQETAQTIDSSCAALHPAASD